MVKLFVKGSTDPLSCGLFSFANSLNHTRLNCGSSTWEEVWQREEKKVLHGKVIVHVEWPVMRGVWVTRGQLLQSEYGLWPGEFKNGKS